MKTKQLHRVALALIGMGLSVSVWAEPLIVKIGSAAPKTGAIAHLGNDNENGALLAIHEINAKGNLTIAGQKVVLQLVGEDDGGDPKMGAVVAQKLVDAGVVAVVGHLNSGVSIPANTVYSTNGMVQISPSSTNPYYTFKSNRTPKEYVSSYRVLAHDGLQGIALAHYVVKRGQEGVVVMDDSTSYGHMLADGFEQTLRQKKVTIVAREKATDKTTDFRAVLTKLKAKGVRVIFWGGMDDTAAALAKQMRDLGIKATLISGDGACTYRFIELAGSAASSLRCSVAGVPLNKMPRGAQFSADYETSFEQPVQIYAPFAYDAVYAIIEAMKIANSTQREAIAEAMPKVDFEGVTGRIHFDKRGDIVNGPMTIFKVKNQRLEVETIVR